MNILETVKKHLDVMTRSERQVATCFTSCPKDFAFNTLEGVANLVDTSTTSVLRFCRRIGFRGFKDFQQAIRSQISYQPQLPEKFLRSVGQTDTILFHTVGRGIQCIQDSFQNLSEQSLNEAVELLIGAKHIYTFGMRESFALSHYAYTRLLSVRPNVHLVHADSDTQIESILGMQKEDVCLAFLFHRYTRTAVQTLTLMSQRGIPVILVTNEPFDQVEELCRILLPCRVDYGGIKNTSVAPIVLADYFCGAVASRLGDVTLAYMKQCEAVFSSAEVL